MNFGEQYQDGPALVRHIVTVWRTAFPDLRLTTDLMVATGDVVVCEMTLQGTHVGELRLIPPLSGPDLAPNGRTFKVKQLHRFVLRNAKIVEHFAVRDDLGMFHPLGHLAALAG
jgi:predicted ester cyclase